MTGRPRRTGSGKAPGNRDSRVTCPQGITVGVRGPAYLFCPGGYTYRGGCFLCLPEGAGACLLVLPGRLIPGGVTRRDAVGVAVRDVAATVHLEDGRRDPLLQLLDLEAGLPFCLRVHAKHSSVVG